MIAGGLLLLFIGGESLVRGSVGVARRLGVSELIIGLTLVGFGTSVPELVTSLRAIETDAVGIAVGNVVGSNIANVLLVLGVAAMIRPILTNPRALARDSAFMVAVTIAFCGLIYFDLFTRPVGIALVVLLVAYVIGSLVWDQRSRNDAAHMHQEEAETFVTDESLVLAGLLAILGIVGVIFGARLLVDGGVQLARAAGISETVVGLTVVAIGTSLPELATSAISALRGRSDVALGNIIGSNIFNMLGIIGITAIVHPFSVVAPQPAARSPLGEDVQGVVELPLISMEDIGALILSVFALVLFAFTGRKIARWEGMVLLAGYCLYFGLLFDIIPTPCDTAFCL